jgi:hypothetical protein
MIFGMTTATYSLVVLTIVAAIKFRDETIRPS